MIVLYIMIVIAYFYAIYYKSQRSLHMLQENLYNENNRYVKWVMKNLKEMTDNLAKFQMMISNEEKYLILEFIKYELWLNCQNNHEQLQTPKTVLEKSQLTLKKEREKLQKAILTDSSIKPTTLTNSKCPKRMLS